MVFAFRNTKWNHFERGIVSNLLISFNFYSECNDLVNKPTKIEDVAGQGPLNYQGRGKK